MLFEGSHEPGHSWQVEAVLNLMPTMPVIGRVRSNRPHRTAGKTRFPSLLPARSTRSSRGNAVQCLLRVGARIGHHCHCQKSGARRPWGHLSLFRRLVVPGTRNYLHATAERLRISYAAVPCYPMLCTQSILQHRSSIDEALASSATAAIVHHCRAMSCARDR